MTDSNWFSMTDSNWFSMTDSNWFRMTDSRHALQLVLSGCVYFVSGLMLIQISILNLCDNLYLFTLTNVFIYFTFRKHFTVARVFKKNYCITFRCAASEKRILT